MILFALLTAKRSLVLVRFTLRLGVTQPREGNAEVLTRAVIQMRRTCELLGT